MSRGREPPGNYGCCCIKTNLWRPHQSPQPRPSIPSQYWRPRPNSEWQSWRPRQPGAAQFKQLRWPVPKPSVKLKPRKLHKLPQEEHGKYMRNLEEQAFGEESRSHHEVLSSSQATLCHSPQPLRGALAALYHLLLGQAPPSPPLILPPRTPSAEGQPSTAISPCQCPNSLLDQKGNILCQSQWGTYPWAETPQQQCWGDLPAPRSERTLPGSSH